jgi:hypothetical protein
MQSISSTSDSTLLWDCEFLRFAQDFGRRLRRRLNASTSLPAVAQNDTPELLNYFWNAALALGEETSPLKQRKLEWATCAALALGEETSPLKQRKLEWATRGQIWGTIAQLPHLPKTGRCGAPAT